MPVLPSYRDQSIDLHSKSIDWFLYEDNTGFYWVNKNVLHTAEFDARAAMVNSLSFSSCCSLSSPRASIFAMKIN